MIPFESHGSGYPVKESKPVCHLSFETMASNQPVFKISGDFGFITQKNYTKERPVPHHISNVYIYHADKECYEKNDGSGKQINRTIELTLGLGKWFAETLVDIQQDGSENLSRYNAKVNWEAINEYDDSKMMTWSKINTASVNLMDIQMAPNEASCGRVHCLLFSKIKTPGDEKTVAFLLPAFAFSAELMTSPGWKTRAYLHRTLRIKKLLPVPVILSYYLAHGEGNLGDRFVFPYAWMAFPMLNPQISSTLHKLSDMQKKHPTVDLDWAWSHLTGSDIQTSIIALNIKTPNIYRHSKSSVRLMKNGMALWKSGLFPELVGREEQEAFMKNVNKFYADLQGVWVGDLSSDSWIDKLREAFPKTYYSVDWDIFRQKGTVHGTPKLLKAVYGLLNFLSKLIMPLGEFVFSSLYAVIRGLVTLPLTPNDLAHAWSDLKMSFREAYENKPSWSSLVRASLSKFVSWGVNFTSNMFNKPLKASITIVKLSIASILVTTGLWVPLAFLVGLQYAQVKIFTFLMSPWFEKNGLNPADTTDLETYVEMWGQF
uniref:Uncharacterized protein n=1 Tax=Rhizoctonia solani fusarivirus 4 TaxID=2870617 RepID=A0A8K1HTF6_9VIRU|nr:hypothetical protein [Rhizoctonia solani fusarivirus 4]UBR58461.1 hypothetical protein [Rhizoctonia solani fusarivirus 4]